MLGKLSQLKWTAGGGGNRDLAFIIVILAFGIIVTAKLAPYYGNTEQSVAYNKVQTTPSIPKQVLEQITEPFGGRRNSAPPSHFQVTSNVSHTDSNRASVLERPLFDGQAVLLRVRSLNEYSSNNSSQPIEVAVVGPESARATDTDYTPAMGGKLIGAGTANLHDKHLFVSFNELISADGRSYSVQGQAVGPENLASGIDGDYSSGLPSRLFGIIIDRTIMAADQIGTGYMFSSIGPQGPSAQELRTAAMETNQQTSQDISAEATKGLRETPAEIKLPAGTPFLVRVRATASGGHP